MSDEIRSCQLCGKKFTVMKNGGGKKFCSKACQVDHNKATATERWHNVYKERARQKRMEAKQDVEKVKVSKPESLAEVQRKAQAAGMSYGKYMLAMRMGQIG